MPQAQDRQGLSTEELRELALSSPFGGIQSELPLTLIEEYGFADSVNIAYRFGEAQVRPTYSILPALPGIIAGEYVTTFNYFWDSLGIQRQVVITNEPGIYLWNGAIWGELTGPALGALTTPNVPWATAVLKQKLCFSKGGNFDTVQVYLYDPVASLTTYVLSSANSPEAFNMAELNLHLMTSNVTDLGVGLFTQRYQWSGAGDPTDWTSFSSGLNDILVDIGPAFGLQKLGQYGFGYHANGIMQIIPTGIGIAPFAFVPLVSGNVGNATAPFSLQKLSLAGTDCGLFVGPDNVYLFNQTSLTAFGNAPIGQRRYIGARRNIMADVYAAGALGVRSHVSRAPGGGPFLAYYLLCIKDINTPSKCPLWVYNFDEENWTRWIFNKVPVAIGEFSLNSGSLYTGNKVGVSFSDGTVGWFDFNQAGAEVSTTITSGKMVFGDPRHKHTEQKFRIRFTDRGPVTFTLTVTNENGTSDSDSITLGTNSGDVLSAVLSVRVTGLRLQYTLSAPANSQFGIVDLAPIYDVGGEQRGGTADGN